MAKKQTELVCTFTANVNCLSCQTALLGSWRAEESMAKRAKQVFANFRETHVGHHGFREGPPCIGMHSEKDSQPEGQTLVSMVVCIEDPDNPGHLKFSPTGNNIYYNL